MKKNASYILAGYKRLKVRDKYELITVCYSAPESHTTIKVYTNLERFDK